MGRAKKKSRNEKFFTSDVTHIRILRLVFYACLIGFLVYLYVLFETGTLKTFLQESGTNLLNFLINTKTFVIEHPFETFSLIGNNAFFLFIGYIIAKRRYS